MEKRMLVPPVTTDPAAVFFAKENPQEAALHEIQYENLQTLWSALLHRDDLLALQYRTCEGSQRILHPSLREGVDWQLSYFDPDGFAAMHADYQKDGQAPPQKGHALQELIWELTADHAHSGKALTLLLKDGEKERLFEAGPHSFLVDLAKLFALSNRVPISPASDLFRVYEKKHGKLSRNIYQRLLTDALLIGSGPLRAGILQKQTVGAVFPSDRKPMDHGSFPIEDYCLVDRTAIEEGHGMDPERFLWQCHMLDPQLGSPAKEGLVVFEKDGRFTVYQAGPGGMRELPDEILDLQTRQRILYGLDMRQEHALLLRYTEFVKTEGIPLDLSQEEARIKEIEQISYIRKKEKQPQAAAKKRANVGRMQKGR